MKWVWEIFFVKKAFTWIAVVIFFWLLGIVFFFTGIIPRSTYVYSDGFRSRDDADLAVLIIAWPLLGLALGYVVALVGMGLNELRKAIREEWFGS